MNMRFMSAKVMNSFDAKLINQSTERPVSQQNMTVSENLTLVTS